MAENDVFNRYVGPGWKAASRLSMMDALDDAAVSSVLKALRNELKTNGCPGFGELIAIVADTAEDEICDKTLLGAYRRLDRVRRDNGSRNSEIASESCKRFCESSQRLGLTSDIGSYEQHRRLVLGVSSRILSDIASTHMFPLAMLDDLRGSLEVRDIYRRQERIKAAIRESVEIEGFASSLMDDSTGSVAGLPRIRCYKPSQRELLDLALTPS